MESEGLYLFYLFLHFFGIKFEDWAGWCFGIRPGCVQVKRSFFGSFVGLNLRPLPIGIKGKSEGIARPGESYNRVGSGRDMRPTKARFQSSPNGYWKRVLYFLRPAIKAITLIDRKDWPAYVSVPHRSGASR